MKPNAVCAVIVTFFPRENVINNIAALREQVENLVIVDNGTCGRPLTLLRAASQDFNCVLLENGSNRGVAAALNVGVRWALLHTYQWVALFDQDSTASDCMVDAMIRKYQASHSPDRVAVVTPKHIEANSGAWNRPSLFTELDSPLTAITSGSLIPSRIFELCGEFEEDLFIDYVDHEYCLRVRSLGYTIALCEDAVLYHPVGAPAIRRVLGIRTVRTLNHRAERRYYIARNQVTMLRRYWRRYPRWCANEFLSSAKEAIKAVLVEEGRTGKMFMYALGVFDGLRGKLGYVVKI